jgi:hypothetical protein
MYVDRAGLNVLLKLGVIVLSSGLPARIVLILEIVVIEVVLLVTSLLLILMPFE